MRDIYHSNIDVLSVELGQASCDGTVQDKLAPKTNFRTRPPLSQVIASLNRTCALVTMASGNLFLGGPPLQHVHNLCVLQDRDNLDLQ